MENVTVFSPTHKKLTLYALMAAPAALGAAICILRPGLNFEADSVCYLQWCANRTSVYPLFLKVANGPFLQPIQVFLLAASAAWLAYFIHVISGRLLLAALMCAAIFSNPYLWQLQSSVMTEALTTPLLIILVGLLAGYLLNRHMPMLVAASLVAGVAAAARPSNMPVLLAPLLAALLVPEQLRKPRLRAVLVAAAVFAVPVVADQMITASVLKDEKTSLLGRHLFAKSVLIQAPRSSQRTTDPLQRKLAGLAEDDFRPVRRVLASVRDQQHIKDILELNYEVCLEYACTDNQLGSGYDRTEIDRALRAVGYSRLREAPAQYLRLVFDEYRRLWLLHPRKHPSIAEEYNRYLSTSAPLPLKEFLGVESEPVPQHEQSGMYVLNRNALLFVAFAVPILTVGLTFLIIRRRATSLLKAAFIYLISAQAVLAFCAMVGVGIPRYTMGVWPLIGASFGILAFEIYARIARFRHPRTALSEVDVAV